MEHLSLIKYLEERGCVLSVDETGTLWIKEGISRQLSDTIKAKIHRLKPLIIEALKAREMVYEILGWDVDHATDGHQLSLFMDEAQEEFEKGGLRREQAEALATRAKKRGRQVPIGPTGYKAVLWTHEGLAARNGISPEQLSSTNWGKHKK